MLMRVFKNGSPGGLVSGNGRQVEMECEDSIDSIYRYMRCYEEF